MYNAVERFFDDFHGKQVIPAVASGQASPWAFAKQGAGSPTILGLSGATSQLQFLLDNTAEAQAVCLYFGDILTFRAQDIKQVMFRLAVLTADIAANQILAFGLTSARNNNPDSTTYNLQFKLAGSTAVVVERDDGATNTDNLATGQILSMAMKEFCIDLSNGLNDVRFLMSDGGGKLVRAYKPTIAAPGLVGQFLQPNIQLSKTSGATTPSIALDYVEVIYRRS